MKRRFTQGDKERILAHEATGKSIVEICRENGITRTSFYEWKVGKKTPRLEGLTAADIRSLKKDHERMSLENQILAAATCSKTASLEDRKTAAAELA